MFRPHFPPTRPDRRGRRGAILLVVLTLLALFAVIGLSFVLYAESEANAARIHRGGIDGVGGNGSPDAPPDFEAHAAAAVSQMLYGTDDDRSVFTGHDLATLKYSGDTATPRYTPYNGVGLFHEQVNRPPGPGVPVTPYFTGLPPFDRADVIHFALVENPFGDPNKTTKFDAERTKGDGTVRSGAGWNGTGTTLPIFVPKNAPYTYPDRNNVMLAMINTLLPTDTLNNPNGIPAGQVVLPSGHRPRLFDPAGAYGPFGLGVRSLMGPPSVNENWFVPTGRFKLLRPRSIDHMTAADVNALPTAPKNERAAYEALRNNTPLNPAQLDALATAAQAGRLGQFPFPAPNADGSVTGDVQNYKYPEGTQRNDSVWMSLNLPTFRYKGKTVQPLVAPFLIALDGRVNTTVAGNLLGNNGTTHASHSGFGPHEINLSKLLTNSAVAQSIIQRRFNGTTTPTPPGLPSTAEASALAGMSSGQYFPNYPAPAAGVYGVHPFQPTDRPASVQPSGMNTVLAVNQYAVPAASQVNYDGLGQKPLPPGDPAQTTPTGQPARFGNTPLYTTYDASRNPIYPPSYDNSRFLPADPTSNPVRPVPQGALLNHPLLWNPYSRDTYTSNSATGVGLFPTSDARRLIARWSDKNENLNQAYMAANFGGEFGGSSPNNPNSRTRALTTPISNSTKFPGVAPNFFGGGQTLRLESMQRVPVLSAAPTFSIPAITTPGTPGYAASYGASDASASTAPIAAGTTDAHNQRLGNVRAALAAVDLNRTLPDYRTSTGSNDKLSNLIAGVDTSNVSDAAGSNGRAARLARQAFAHDIFLRLAVATGASVRYDAGVWRLPQPTGVGMYAITLTTPGTGQTNPVTVTTEEYNALRWLAQMAANIVDAVDPDDISTAFVWNPQVPDDAQETITPPADPARSNFSTTVETTATMTPTNGQSFLDNRVVFGVEKPRLVLNEVYAEVVNDSTTAATPFPQPARAPQPFRARFFLELLNPTNADRDSIQPDRVPLSYGTTAVYRVRVYDDAAGARRSFDGAQRPANATGRVTDAAGTTEVAPKLECNLASLTANTGDTLSGTSVEANNGTFAANTTATPPTRNGFAVIGPDAEMPAGTSFNPAAPFDTLVVRKPTPAALTSPPAPDSLVYTMPPVRDADIRSPTSDTGKPQAVVLRRLANPYLPPNPANSTDPINTTLAPNPYITVDVMNDVKLQDALGFAASADGTRTVTHTAPTAAERKSVGRVQPYTGFQSGADLYDAMTMANKSNTLTLAQARSVGGTQQKQTLFEHNSSSTDPATFDPANPNTTDPNLIFPFEWLPHFDRRLINQSELLNVAAVMPHELTQRFAAPNPTAGQRPTFHQHAAELPLREQTAVGGTAPAAPQVYPPLYRAMEFLTVKPWTRDNPEGGRTAGKINVNMIWDRAVFDALIDGVAAASTTGNRFTPDEVNELWNQFKASRTPNYPFPGNTAGEVGPATGGPVDRPFQSFGVGRFDGGGNLVGTPPNTPASGVEDTLLRKVSPIAPTPIPGTPPLFSRYTATGVRVPPTGTSDPDPVQPYAESELLRKVLNNVTTTSDTFLFAFTIGYFEVRQGTYNVNGDPIVLGREVFNQVPGDLRKQYASVLDRSNLMATTPPTNFDQSAGASWVAELQNRVRTIDPATGLPPTTPVQLQLLLPVGLDDPAQTGWNGASLPPPSIAQNRYRATGNPPGEYPITPSYSGNTPYGYQLTGRYEGRDFKLEAISDPTNPTGTVFALGPKGLNVGTGDRQAVLQAFYNGTPATQWTYDPLNGRVRITAKVISSSLPEYPAGTILSNVTFGLPAGTQKFELQGPPNPAVPFFGELRP